MISGARPRVAVVLFPGSNCDHDAVHAVETAIGTEAKRALYARLHTGRQEGIVFKKISSDYGHGKNDDQIKIKFCERATLEVSSVHPTKRSISVRNAEPEIRKK